MTSEPLRRVLHASSAAILVVSPLTSWTVLRWVVTSAAAVALLHEIVRLRSTRFNAVVTRWLPVYRPSEMKRWSGAPWLWVGYAIAVWIPDQAGVGAILVTALADPSASMVGSLVGGVGKTWSGTATHALVGVVVLAAVGWPLPVALAAALVGASLERWPRPFNDNLLVPTAIALTYWVLA